VKAGLQPGQQAGFGAVQINASHAYLGESKRLAPGAQPGQQGLPVRLPWRHALLIDHLPVTVAHPPILETRQLQWPDEDACQAWAAALAQRPGIDNAFIELHGPLGAGKTTLVRHLLRALGVTGRIKSPTYAVMEPHVLGNGAVASHFDFYRFTDPREWLDAGFRDVFGQPGLKLAEWPDHAGGVLPVPDLRVIIEPQDEQTRNVSVQACTPAGLGLL